MKTKIKSRVIGYCRCSLDEQATEGKTLPMQESRIRAYAVAQDLELVDMIVDAGEWSGSLDRPGLQRALAALKSGDADGIVVLCLDRLSRSVADLAKLTSECFQDHQLYSVMEQIDPRSPAGRLFLNMMVSFSQFERERIGERTRNVMRHKAALGERVGKVPYGYDLGLDGVHLIKNCSEHDVIQSIRDMRQQGLSLRRIAQVLSESGIETKEARGRWSHQSVDRIVQRA
jgi:site-specific DNA recombinase